MADTSLYTSLPEIVTAQVPGPKSKALLDRRDAALPKALCGKTYPICIKQGAGAMFEDLDGNKFLDWVGGVGVLNIGYSRPEVVKAVQEQAEKYFHTIFNVIVHDGYVTLAERLNEIMPCKGDKKKTYFANSGAECDENAIKIAKAYTKRSGVICFTGAFHGRTNLTMALTAKKTYARGMGPFPAGIYRAPYPYLYRAPKGYTETEAIQYYLDELNRIFDEGAPANEIACMIVEPFQGEGGFIPAPIEWVKAVRKICDDNGIMLIADEVQCGNCRTGKYFASEYWAEAGCAPDIITTAKSVGGGAPISAITGKAEVMDAAPAGTIGGTFCGNPLACASALAVMDIMQKEDFAGKAQHIGEVIADRYMELKEEYPVIGDVRRLGAMIHAVESFLSPNSCSISRVFSKTALEIIVKSWEKAVKNGGGDAWKKYSADFLKASNYAGLAFGYAGCAAVHALSYPLGSVYHIPHGQSNQLMFAEVMKAYKEIKPVGAINDVEKIVAECLGVTPDSALDALYGLLDEVLPRKPLREFGAKESDLAVFASEVPKTQQRLLKNNYVPLTEEQIFEIYKKVF